MCDPVTAAVISMGTNYYASQKIQKSMESAEKKAEAKEEEALKKQKLADAQALLAQQQSNITSATSNIDLSNRLTQAQSAAVGQGGGVGGKLGKSVGLGGSK